MANKQLFDLPATKVTLKENGTELEVYANGKILRVIQQDENPTFAIWRIFNALTEKEGETALKPNP